MAARSVGADTTSHASPCPAIMSRRSRCSQDIDEFECIKQEARDKNEQKLRSTPGFGVRFHLCDDVTKVSKTPHSGKVLRPLSFLNLQCLKPYLEPNNHSIIIC